MKHYDKTSWFKKANKNTEPFHNLIVVPDDLEYNDKAKERFINGIQNWKKPTKNVILIIKTQFDLYYEHSYVHHYVHRPYTISEVLGLGASDDIYTKELFPTNLFLTDKETSENFQFKERTPVKMKVFSESDFHFQSYADHRFFKYALEQISLSDFSILEVSLLFHPFIKELLKDMNVITVMFRGDAFNYFDNYCPTDEFNANGLLEMLLLEDLKTGKRRFYFSLPNAETRERNLIALQKTEREFLQTSCEVLHTPKKRLLVGNFFEKKYNPLVMLDKEPRTSIF